MFRSATQITTPAEPSAPTTVRPYFPAGRTCVLVDIENLVRDAEEDRAVPVVLDQVLATLGIQASDHVIVAAGPRLAAEAFHQVPRRCRLLLGHGVDGADLALLEAVEPADLARRYDRVIVASGDGIFAPLVAELGRLGVAAHVACRPGDLSARLKLAARKVTALSFDSSVAA